MTISDSQTGSADTAYIAQRARRAEREKFLQALQQIVVVGNEAAPEDALPEDLRWLQGASVGKIITGAA